MTVPLPRGCSTHLLDAQPAVLVQGGDSLPAQLLLLLQLRPQRLDREQQRVDLLVRQVHRTQHPRPLAGVHHGHRGAGGRARVAAAPRAASSRDTTAHATASADGAGGGRRRGGRAGVRVERHRLGRPVPQVRHVLHHWLHHRQQVLDLAAILNLLDLQLIVLGLEALAALALVPQIDVRVTQRLLKVRDLLHPLVKLPARLVLRRLRSLTRLHPLPKPNDLVLGRCKPLAVVVHELGRHGHIQQRLAGLRQRRVDLHCRRPHAKQPVRAGGSGGKACGRQGGYAPTTKNHLILSYPIGNARATRSISSLGGGGPTVRVLLYPRLDDGRGEQAAHRPALVVGACPQPHARPLPEELAL